MWASGSSQDPGGPSNPESSASKEELKDLKEQNDQQQVLIAQLKEILRKTEKTSVSEEKVVEFANTLTKMSARAKKSQLKDNNDESRSSQVQGKTQASEKINLLREQLRQNKIKLAERDKNQKGIEKMVTQIKEQLDSSQLLLSQTPLNISLIEERVDYSANTSSQELYNILLKKDKLINDLNGKITKLEGKVLDLQENVKEKDSVIDARTKAITLMSESLSRKGKTTLDALDETKEQMRSMQENFVKMEEEIKAENQNLLQQLEQKNSIIDNLKAENDSLINKETSLEKELEILKANHLQEIETLNGKICDLESNQTKLQTTPRDSPVRSSRRGKKGKQQKQEENVQITEINKIEELEATICLLRTEIDDNEKINNEKQELLDEIKNKFKESKESYECKIKVLEESLSKINIEIENRPKEEVSLESDDLVKLRQQLDESNKAMIKIKAFHKSKVKELNKKIDNFKKMGDVNAEVVRLDLENSKLSQKVAELEEEKGQLQLNMIDSKESINLDEVNELKAKLKDFEETVESNEKSIKDLKDEIVKKEESLQSISNKLEVLNSSISDQVKSDLTSVQFEEELENLLSKNKLISEQKQEIEEKCITLQEELELVKKEKCEISVKLESISQENMELTDRLEKLSTEKVSSAESIEFVENLTLQEKLELEAYQRSLAMKTVENTDDYPELNNTVKQINEETSELVHKIEMYNIERREVMEKMENLTTENNQLILKIKEIENNRDVLIETYELLQTEKEDLNNKVKELEDNNADLEEKCSQSYNLEDLEEYKSLVDIQKQEIRELKVELLSLKEFEDKFTGRLSILESENETLKLQLQKGEQHIDDSKLKEYLEEIDFYKNIVEENKDELIKSSNTINDLQAKISENKEIIENYHKEVESLNSIILEFKTMINTLEEEKENFIIEGENINLMSNELQILKSSLQEYSDQIDTYEKELTENKDVINKLNLDIKNLNATLVNTQDHLVSKDDEILKCNQKLEDMSNNNQELQSKLDEKDAKYQQICEELKQKYLTLQKQLENNTGTFGPLQERINELESKNKEQLQKMKKIAANLKKRNSEFKDLETNLVEVKEKWENEVKEKDDFKNKAADVVVKLSESEHEIKLLRNNLEELKISYEVKLDEIKKKYDKLKESNYNLEQNNVDLMNTVSNFTARSEDYQNIIREYENQISNLSNELELFKFNANNVSNIELNERDEIIRNLNGQIEKMGTNYSMQINVLESKIKDLEDLIENKNVELTKISDNLKTFEEALKILEEKRNLGSNISIALENRFKVILNFDEHTKLQLENLTSENCILQEKLEALVSEKNSITIQLAEVTEKIRTLENSSTSKDEINELLNVRNSLESENEKLNNLIKNLQQDKDKSCKDLQEEIDQYSNERDHLLLQLDSSKKDCVRLEEKLEECYKINDHLKEEISRKKTDFDENYKHYQTIDYEYKTNLNLIEDLNIKIYELQNSLTQNTSKLETYFNLFQIKDTDDLEKNIGDLRVLIADKQRLLQNSTTSVADFFNNFTNESNNSDLCGEIAYLNIILQQHVSRYTEIEALNRQIIELQKSKLDVEDTIVQQNIAQATSKPTDDSYEELKNKVKTLEFMLHNTEQEKENALMQCENFSSELAKFLYEKENSYMSEIESQIISGEEITISPKMKTLMTHNLHTPDNTQPINEPPCVSKQAYQCFPEEKTAFNENDDGWGFGCEDVKLEAEHVQQSTSSFNQELNERLKVLEIEREKHLEEIKQGQIKCGKLIKKLKELKVKNEQLSKKHSEEFLDLNDAIVDELKQQIAILEKRIKENTTEFEKEKNEKLHILKRIDVLTAANERMVEMKEKQDIEVIRYQQSIRELNLKLEQVAWDDDKHDSEPAQTSEDQNEPLPNDRSLDLQNKIDELRKTISELTLDNEELQLLLEEQHSLRLEAEKARSNLVLNENIQSDYNKTVEENVQLNKNLLLSEEKIKDLSQKLHSNYSERTQLEATILDNNLTIDALRHELQDLNNSFEDLMKKDNSENVNELKQQLDLLEGEKWSLNLKIQEVLDENNQVKASLDMIIIDKNNLDRKVNELMSDVDKLKIDIEEKDEHIGRLHKTIGDKNEDLIKLERLMNDKELLINEKDVYINQITQEKESLVFETESKINEIQMQLHEKDLLIQEKYSEINQKYFELKEKDAIIAEKSSTIEEKEKSINDLIIKINDGDKDFNERVADLVSNLEQKWIALVDERGNDVAASWKNHLDIRENEFSLIQDELNNKLSDLQEKCNILLAENEDTKLNACNTIKISEDEINQFKIRIQSLDEQNEKYLAEINDLKKSCENLSLHVEKLNDALVLKENERVNVQEQLDALTSPEKLLEINRFTEELTKIEKYKNKIKELNEENEKLNDINTKLTNLNGELQEKENLINEALKAQTVENKLLQELVAQSETIKNENTHLEEVINCKNIELDKLNTKLNEYVTRIDQDFQIKLEKERDVLACSIKLQNTELHIQNLMHEIAKYKNMAEAAHYKDIEINRLNGILNEKEQEYNYNFQTRAMESEAVIYENSQQIDLLKRKLQETENNFEETILAKDAEIDIYKEQFKNFVDKPAFEQLSFELADKNNKLLEAEQILEEDEKQLIELKNIIEEQVLKIEDLQRELLEKSGNYDALIAELKGPHELRSQLSKVDEDNLTEPVSRAELDLALYMLHQRDVRCEELTVELMQLLEERDTLQLKLSNALREKEDLKIKKEPIQVAKVKEVAKTSSASGAISKSTAIILGATGTEMAAEATEEGQLENKLTELKIVGYKKDKSLLDDQELRRLTILQQHKDEISKLPPEAAARLVDASYTLSRDVQSPSKVLLNWLWGKSTPKVNNI